MMKSSEAKIFRLEDRILFDAAAWASIFDVLGSEAAVDLEMLDFQEPDEFQAPEIEFGAVFNEIVPSVLDMAGEESFDMILCGNETGVKISGVLPDVERDAYEPRREAVPADYRVSEEDTAVMEVFGRGWNVSTDGGGTYYLARQGSQNSAGGVFPVTGSQPAEPSRIPETTFVVDQGKEVYDNAAPLAYSSFNRLTNSGISITLCEAFKELFVMAPMAGVDYRSTTVYGRLAG